MEKINQRVMLTKRLLKESFAEMLAQKDIRKISIRELCEHAGINHCTFYKYYGSQYDLLQEMEDDLLQKIEQALTSYTEHNMVQTLLGYMQDNIKIARILINNNADPLLPEKLFALPMIQQKLTQRLQTLYADNEIEYVSHFIFHGAFRLFQIWINKDRRESPREMSDLLLQLLDKLIELTPA